MTTIGEQAHLIEARLEILDDTGFDEINALMTELHPEIQQELEAMYREHGKPKYVRLAGSDRVCSRCGALVHQGGRKQHNRYHKNLTKSIWLLQGWAVAWGKKLEEEIEKVHARVDDTRRELGWREG